MKIGWVTCPRCRGVFDIDRTMLDVDGVYFHCPYCHLEPIKLGECEVNLGNSRLLKGERGQSTM